MYRRGEKRIRANELTSRIKKNGHLGSNLALYLRKAVCLGVALVLVKGMLSKPSLSGQHVLVSTNLADYNRWIECLKATTG